MQLADAVECCGGSVAVWNKLVRLYFSTCSKHADTVEAMDEVPYSLEIMPPPLFCWLGLISYKYGGPIIE